MKTAVREDFMTDTPPLGLLLMQPCQNTIVLHLKNSLSSEMTYDEEQAYNTSRAINDDKIETYSKEDKKDDDTSKEIQEDTCKAASCKNSTRYLHGG
jgi:hypothetical protein